MDEFLTAVAKVPGLEYLAEELGDLIEDTAEFAKVDRHRKRSTLRRELFVVASDERAARELERLWAKWAAGQALERGWGTWKTVFERLVTVRQWNDNDRLSRTGVADAWRAELADADTELIPFEVELWYRADAARRQAERDRVASALTATGGKLIGEYQLPEISYHGLLAELPGSVLLETAQTMRVAWLSGREGRGVRFLRAAGQTGIAVDEAPGMSEAASPTQPIIDRSPRIAVLDGVPVARHALLDGRVILDDPDGWEEATEVRHPTRTMRAPGIEVASPGTGGRLDRTTWVQGTSPATALATRAGAQILKRLDALRTEWDAAMPGPEFDAVLVKALLVHGATWGPAEAALRKAFRDATGAVRKEDLGRALGYGLLRPDWPLIDDDYRVTAIYASTLGDGTHEYRLPLPPSLASRTDWRRITVTLAWLTPVNVAHRGYRRAKLRVDATGSKGLARARQQADNNAVVRGTVQHEVLEGTDAIPFADGDDLAFTIVGSAGAGIFDGTVPYAFAVTLETAEAVGLPIHAEVTARLRARVARIRA